MWGATLLNEPNSGITQTYLLGLIIITNVVLIFGDQKEEYADRVFTALRFGNKIYLDINGISQTIEVERMITLKI